MDNERHVVCSEYRNINIYFLGGSICAMFEKGFEKG